MADAPGWRTPWSRAVVPYRDAIDDEDTHTDFCEHPWERRPRPPPPTAARHVATRDARPASPLPAMAFGLVGTEPRPPRRASRAPPPSPIEQLGVHPTEIAAAALAVSTAQLRAQRKPARLCKAAGCDKYIVHKGLCCRHGGGKPCSVDGCHASAKQRGLCWRHGGSSECKVDGCPNKAKAKGLCWSHGGGTPCALAACPKIAVSNGLCWAHGGGKRCIHDGCQRPAFERTHGFCDKHFRELQHVDYYEV